MAIGDLDGAAAATAAAELPGAPGLGLRFDVTDRASVDAAVAELDDRLMNVNLRGVLIVTQRVLAGMLDRRSGRSLG